LLSLVEPYGIWRLSAATKSSTSSFVFELRCSSLFTSFLRSPVPKMFVLISSESKSSDEIIADDRNGFFAWMCTRAIR
jgi:hypothetical protein